MFFAVSLISTITAYRTNSTMDQSEHQCCKSKAIRLVSVIHFFKPFLECIAASYGRVTVEKTVVNDKHALRQAILRL